MAARLVKNVVKGAVAGFVGTAAMTLTSTVEAKLRGRGESLTPAEAAEKVLHVHPGSKQAERKLSNAMHWAYGTGWGAFGGVLETAGLRGGIAAGALMGSVWGTELGLLPRLGVVEKPTEWGAKELGIDALHHAAYIATTTATLEALHPGR